MKIRIGIILSIIGICFISSQELIKYSFKKNINHVLQDSLYTAFETAINKYPIKQSKYINSGALPLKFVVWNNNDSKSKLSKNYDILFQNNPLNYNLKFSFYPHAVNKEGTSSSDLVIDTNKLLIYSQKDNSQDVRINTYLNALEVTSDSDNDKDKSWLLKSFFCKTHMISNDYIDSDHDFKIFNTFYYNTLSISYENKIKKIKFEIIIYEKVSGLIDNQNNLLMRKVIIKENNKEAIEYLKKNRLDYSNINDADFKEDDFKKI